MSSGAVRCWGDNSYGELAQGNTETIGDDTGETTVAVDLGGHRATQVSGSGYTFCAVLDTGALRCWGYGGDGLLAQGNSDDIGDGPGETTVAVDLGPGRTAVSVSVGGYTACAILDTGGLRCWGSNSNAELGQGNAEDIGDDPGETTVPVDLGVGRTAVAVSAGDYSACAILDTGALRCWGYNSSGQLAQGNTDEIGDDPGETTVAVDLGAGRTAVAVSVSPYSVCAILDTGALRCWGYGFNGQLAQGNTDAIGDEPGETTVPVDLGFGRTAVALSVGDRAACAILDNGALRCWGRNDSGELGQGNTDSIGDSPGETTVGLDLGVGRTAIAVVASFTGICVATDDRVVRCLGDSSYGQLAQGSTTEYGVNPGETPAAAGPVLLGGSLLGNDTDSDGVRDAVDSCPTNQSITAGSCSPAPPVVTGPAAPTVREAVLRRKSVVLAVRVVTATPTTACTGRVKLHIRTRTKSGPLHLVKRLSLVTVGSTCTATGKVKLPQQPRHSARVKVVVVGKQIHKRTLRAVRLP